MNKLLLEDETFKIIGICMEIHRLLGPGFREPVYKDAMCVEFDAQGVPFERERRFNVEYKGIILPHKYFADYVAYSSIILEIKSSPFIIDRFVSQTINYLKASGMRVGLIINFGEKSLRWKRVIF